MKRSIDRYFKKAKFDRAISQLPSKKIHSQLHVEISEFMGRKVVTMRPKTGQSRTHILFFHGGAYIFGIQGFHYDLAFRLVKALGCSITIPDYPLAPQHCVSDVYDMIVPLYKEMAIRDDVDQLVLMGDSSGGGIALGLAQYLKANHIRQPFKIVLLSPWLDVSMENPDIKVIDKKDPILSIDGLKMAGKSYANQGDIKNYLVSPIYGDIEGLADISLFISTNDLLYPDAKKFKNIMEQKNMSIRYHEYEGLFHDWMLFDLKESRDVVSKVKDFIYNET